MNDFGDEQNPFLYVDESIIHSRFCFKRNIGEYPGNHREFDENTIHPLDQSLPLSNLGYDSHLPTPLRPLFPSISFGFLPLRVTFCRKMIQFFLIFNKLGQTRFAQYYNFQNAKERATLEGEVTRMYMGRREEQVRRKAAGL